jgi:surfactin synthase thioesterase subunit
MRDSPWFVRFGSAAAPKLWWYAFPYAGGAASVFRPLALALPADTGMIAVQLPGRHNRLRDRRLHRVPAVLDALWPDLISTLDTAPIAIWGHSLGALLAFEVARRLQREHRVTPRLLLVSGRRAPNLPLPGDSLTDLGDDAFIDAVEERYGGMSPLMRSDPDLRALTLPALRADMEMYEAYQCEAGPSLACPITALYGKADPLTSTDSVRSWREFTIGDFTMAAVAGSHFFPFDAGAKAEMVKWLTLFS